MANISMKHLRYFDALARLGHFGRAAELCAISQPALSMQIRELETLIGAPLVERGTRQIRLTSLGEEFAATNGILQGCPLSVVLLNGMAAIWSRAVAACTSAVSFKAFASSGFRSLRPAAHCPRSSTGRSHRP